MSIAAIIGIMIAVVVGVNLIPFVNDKLPNIVSNVTGNSTGAGGAGLGSLPGLMAIIFVTVIIIGAVAWIGSSGREEEPKEDKSICEPDKPVESESITRQPATASQVKRARYDRNKEMCPCGSGKKYKECCGM